MSSVRPLDLISAYRSCSCYLILPLRVLLLAVADERNGHSLVFSVGFFFWRPERWSVDVGRQAFVSALCPAFFSFCRCS